MKLYPIKYGRETVGRGVDKKPPFLADPGRDRNPWPLVDYQSFGHSIHACKYNVTGEGKPCSRCEAGRP